jgi:hypothetical protein
MTVHVVTTVSTPFARRHLTIDIRVQASYSTNVGYAYAISALALRCGIVTVPPNPAVFRRLLHERCMTGEELRKALGLSPTTLAKLYRGAPIRDDVFHRVVLELERRPVKPIARELAGSVSPEEATGGAR